MEIKFEENLQAKEEELMIMNNLMNSPCETEPGTKFLNLEEQMITKYERVISDLKEENERNLVELQKYYEIELQSWATDRENLLKEINKQKQEIYKLRGYIPNKEKPYSKTHRESTSQSIKTLSEENKEKILQNLLYKIK